MTTTDKEKPVTEKTPIDPNVAKGTYANGGTVAFSSVDFILDFQFNSPSGEMIVSRIILCPQKYERLVAAMQSSLRKYELQFGEISQKVEQ